jgi:ABC-2 type transport system ATP-binding protein
VSASATPAGEPALQVRGLSKRYGGREALRDLDFEVEPGEMVAVIGPNGAGKTTLLSIVAGVQAPSAGTVSRQASEVGWAPQQPAVYSKLSVRENLRLFARLEGVGDVDGAVARMLTQTGLGERAEDLLQHLSAGNRQRVNVAVGLLADPPVLALDEPSTALDPTQRARLFEFIAQIAAGGSAVVFSTHIVEEAQRYADRVLVLDGGHRRFFGAPAVLAASQPGCEDFESAFVSFLAKQADRAPSTEAQGGKQAI